MLSIKEIERYKRQLTIDGFDLRAQKRLKSSTALIAGIGGVGGTAAIYLAVAGIGRLILIHKGELELPDLNRQILMTSDHLGKPRVTKAGETIKGVNPHVEVEVYDRQITQEFLKGLLPQVDIVLDCRHNFPERRVLNDGCVLNRTPMVEVAMNGMEGYLFNIVPGMTPCLHCLYPEDPDWDPYGFPVLGAVAGTVGCISSIETIKILTGFKEPLLNELLYLDLGGMKFKRFRIRRRKECDVCGATSLQDTPVSVKRQAGGSGGYTCL